MSIGDEHHGKEEVEVAGKENGKGKDVEEEGKVLVFMGEGTMGVSKDGEEYEGRRVDLVIDKGGKPCPCPL